MSGRKQGSFVDLDRIFHVDELREELQAPALLDFVGMNEGILERSAVCLCEELLACAVPEVCVEDDAGHLPLLAEGVDRQRDDIVLAVAVNDDDLAEAGVPEACQYIADVVRQDLLGNHDGSLLAEVVIRVRAVPDGHCNCAAGLLSDQFAEPCIQIGVLAVGSAGAVVLSGADGKEQNVVLFKPLFQHFCGHVLVVNTILFLHVAAFCGQIPF